MLCKRIHIGFFKNYLLLKDLLYKETHLCILLYFAISVVGTLDLVVLKSLPPHPIAVWNHKLCIKDFWASHIGHCHVRVPCQ